jgi:Fe-S-cluster-containing dehydrogenase component
MSPYSPVSYGDAERKKRNLINVYQYGPVIHGDRVHQSFVCIACMHCEDAPCISVCPVFAIHKDPETGITLVDRNRCIGCKVCLWVCSYGAPSFDEEGKLILCDLCIDRLKEGKKAACEAACPARAILVGSPDEISEFQAKKAVTRIGKSVMTE